jgi:hypothetical protein
MVNPSTADAVKNDQTIKKLIGFGNIHQWGRLIVGNLFAYRATDVKELARVAAPVGLENDHHLRGMLMSAERVIVAWGPITKQPRYHRARWRVVNELIRHCGTEPFSIGEPAKCGHPKHPQMLAYALPILPWIAP